MRDEFDKEVSDAVGQRNEMWLQARVGQLTASRYGDMMSKGRGKDIEYGARAETYIYEKVGEILTQSVHSFTSQATDWGNEMEAEAIRKYQEQTGHTVTSSGYVEYIQGIAGGSPDGLIKIDGIEGIIEVKCPWNPGNHVKTLLLNQVTDKNYQMQIQGYLMITDRRFCDFISYDPRVQDESLQMVIIRVERDEEMILAIENRIYKVWERIQELIDELKS